jgi:hypothetical protein
VRRETDPVPETLCSLVFRIPDDDKVQKPSNSECLLIMFLCKSLPAENIKVLQFLSFYCIILLYVSFKYSYINLSHFDEKVFIQ